MIDADDARRIIEAATKPGKVVFGHPEERENGWHFPCVDRLSLLTGIYVDKLSGAVLRVRADSDLDRDPTLYDRGFMFEEYDLVILSVADADAAVRILEQEHFGTVDVYYRNDRVYRVGRALTGEEIRGRLAALPAVLTGHLVHLRALEEAAAAGIFEFRALQCRKKT